MAQERIDQAEQIFAQGFNCCQAILSTFGPPLGLDRESALKLGAGFGGGMANMGHTCGAVTGAFMVLGLRHGRTRVEDLAARDKTNALVKEFTARFQACHGSVECRQLLNCDLTNPAEFQRAKDSGVFTTLCPKFVRTAATILEEMESLQAK